MSRQENWAAVIFVKITLWDMNEFLFIPSIFICRILVKLCMVNFRIIVEDSIFLVNSLTELHLQVFLTTVRHTEIKEPLVEVCVLQQGITPCSAMFCPVCVKAYMLG